MKTQNTWLLYYGIVVRKVSNLKIAKTKIGYYLIGQNVISNLDEVAVYILDIFMSG